MLQSTKLLLFTVILIVIGGNQLKAKLIGPHLSHTSNYTSAIVEAPVVSISTPNTITTTVRSTITPKPKTTETPNAYNHPKFHLAKQTLNWFGASVYCMERNWKLIVLDSEKIRLEFENYLTKYKLRNQPIWTAGNQLADMKTWRWGLNGPKLTYSHWGKHQPDNYKKQQHCIKLFENSLEWDDDNCERIMNFVCLKH